MEHTGMARMFKSLATQGLGFLDTSGFVYENAVVEFFANAKSEKKTGDGSNTPEQDEHMECQNETSQVDEKVERMEYENQTGTESQVSNVCATAQGELDNSTDGGPEGLVENEEQIENAEHREQEESNNQTEKEADTNEGAIVIDPAAKGKGVLEILAQPNPVEEHCQLVLKTAWEDVSSKMADYDEWMHFRTADARASGNTALSSPCWV
ncbi:methyl-CpG-binding domain-containing protein 2-like [Dorcoceras hygrometricum]|uniref:Methyl-CpG-binding domain-containing protein 2-like n=1 Tax=Dorcoceras hygrometricum TaxID=472368 RepID=A0A2Z7BE07_9LAMI|nr:methyl-CpG-binding domain-containing protein 2-like [Dorcoceras hygrometricum]